MNLSIIWYAFLLYIGYKFVTKIVFPIGKTFLALRKQVKNIKQQFQSNEPNDGAETTTQQTSTKKAKPIKVKSDYIDFEDIK